MDLLEDYQGDSSQSPSHCKDGSRKRTLVDVGRVSLLADLALLLFVTISWRSLLRGLLRSLVSGGLRWCLRGSGGRSLASSGSGFGGHCDEV